MALSPGTYTQGSGQRHQDAAINAATLADGTLRQRFDVLAYPQKGITLTGTHPTTAAPVPATARTTHGAGS